jgi:hypothetical protein
MGLPASGVETEAFERLIARLRQDVKMHLAATLMGSSSAHPQSAKLAYFAHLEPSAKNQVSR